MAVNSIAGSAFTFGVGATPTYYTTQITDGTVTTTPTVERVRTLGPDAAFVGTDIQWSADVNFLYDEESGFYAALDTATASNDALAVEITGGGGQWTGTLYVTALSTSYAADGLATCSASFEGTLAFATAA